MYSNRLNYLDGSFAINVAGSEIARVVKEEGLSLFEKMQDYLC